MIPTPDSLKYAFVCGMLFGILAWNIGRYVYHRLP